MDFVTGSFKAILPCLRLELTSGTHMLEPWHVYEGVSLLRTGYCAQIAQRSAVLPLPLSHSAITNVRPCHDSSFSDLARYQTKHGTRTYHLKLVLESTRLPLHRCCSMCPYVIHLRR